MTSVKAITLDYGGYAATFLLSQWSLWMTVPRFAHQHRRLGTVPRGVLRGAWVSGAARGRARERPWR